VFIQTGDNLGFAGGNNVGIRYAQYQDCEYFCILNNDTVVHSNFLNHLIQASLEVYNAGILGPKILFYNNMSVIQSFGAKMNLWTGRGKLLGLNEVDSEYFSNILDVDWVSGAAMLIKKDFLIKSGMFDEEFYLCYEETDLCYRAKKAGLKILAVPTSLIWHKGGASLKGSSAEYYLVRNRALFMKKNAKKLQLVTFLFFYIFGTFKRILAYKIHGDWERSLAAAKGLKHGLLNLIGYILHG
jgi:GT2 family glycosyltransferase